MQLEMPMNPMYTPPLIGAWLAQQNSGVLPVLKRGLIYEQAR